MSALLVRTPEEAEVAVFFRHFVMLFHDTFEVFAPDAFVKIEAIRHLKGDFGNRPKNAERNPPSLEQVRRAFVG